MADESIKAVGPFDVASISQLLPLMKEYDISEIDLRNGEQRILLRRGQRVITTTAPIHAAPTPMIPAMPIPSAPSVASGASAPEVPATSSKKPLLEIKSELVGTFYAKPAPEKDDYVKIGSRVSPDTVVCQVEAMKIFNQITAKCSGTIVEICVQNGAFVEFDQVLFRVEAG